MLSPYLRKLNTNQIPSTCFTTSYKTSFFFIAIDLEIQSPSLSSSPLSQILRSSLLSCGKGIDLLCLASKLRTHFNLWEYWSLYCPREHHNCPQNNEFILIRNPESSILFHEILWFHKNKWLLLLSVNIFGGPATWTHSNIPSKVKISWYMLDLLFRKKK